jgi:hypothetical protein
MRSPPLVEAFASGDHLWWRRSPLVVRRTPKVEPSLRQKQIPPAEAFVFAFARGFHLTTYGGRWQLSVEAITFGGGFRQFWCRIRREWNDFKNLRHHTTVAVGDHLRWTGGGRTPKVVSKAIRRIHTNPFLKSLVTVSKDKDVSSSINKMYIEIKLKVSQVIHMY